MNKVFLFKLIRTNQPQMKSCFNIKAKKAYFWDILGNLVQGISHSVDHLGHRNIFLHQLTWPGNPAVTILKFGGYQKGFDEKLTLKSLAKSFSVVLQDDTLVELIGMGLSLIHI